MKAAPFAPSLAALPLPSGAEVQPVPGVSLPSQPFVPSQYYDAVNNAPIIGTASLPIAVGTTVLSMITSIPSSYDLLTLLQGVTDPAVADIIAAVIKVTIIGQAVNVGQFGSIATLTNLPAVQSAVSVINQLHLITIFDAVESKSIVYSTAADALLSNVIVFIQIVEELVPLVSHIKAAVKYIMLDQLELAAARDVLGGTSINSLPGGDGAV